MSNKLNIGKQQRRGLRRQKLHEMQNDKGNPENKGEYKDFEGNPVK
ncbi:MAG: clostri-philic family protein [Cellulosilyticaceae bacterium]